MNCEQQGTPHVWMQISDRLWSCLECDAVTEEPHFGTAILDDEFRGCPRPEPEPPDSTL